MSVANHSATAPALPTPRGEVSAGLIDAMRDTGSMPDHVAELDPFGEDVQLALHVCYELHYQGFSGVDEDWEWDPDLLRLRAGLERNFLDGLHAEIPGGEDVEGELAELLIERVPATGVTPHLAERAQRWQLHEYLIHRSIYHLKEADPHAWVIPRLRGAPKAALVAVEYDEFGGGRAADVHAQLYADLLDGAGLSSGYLHYLDQVPAPMLAVVNVMSLFGLHRSLRGALVGHFTTAEISTPPSAKRMMAALRRACVDDPRCLRFYDEHIEADAVHEQIMRSEVVGGLLAQDPAQAGAVVLGIQATELVEARFGEHLLSAWRSGKSSLRSS